MITLVDEVKIRLNDMNICDADTALIESCLYDAKQAILERRYPYGFDADQILEPQFRSRQIRAAVALYNKVGAEGQTSHSENGVQRVYTADDIPSAILNSISPVAKVGKPR